MYKQIRDSGLKKGFCIDTEILYLWVGDLGVGACLKIETFKLLGFLPFKTRTYGEKVD